MPDSGKARRAAPQQSGKQSSAIRTDLSVPPRGGRSCSVSTDILRRCGWLPRGGTADAEVRTRCRGLNRARQLLPGGQRTPEHRSQVMPSARDGSARGVSGGGARLLDVRYADQAEALPIADSAACCERGRRRAGCHDVRCDRHWLLRCECKVVTATCLRSSVASS